MAKCEHCGNEYNKTFDIRFKGETHLFDSFECTIQKMAPECNHCGCKIIGHGVENSGRIFAAPIAPERVAKTGLCNRA